MEGEESLDLVEGNVVAVVAVVDDVTVIDLVDDDDATVTARVVAVETLTVVAEVRYEEGTT